MYSTPTDMERVKLIANKYNLKLIEDACQVVGAGYKGKRIFIYLSILQFPMKIFTT